MTNRSVKEVMLNAEGNLHGRWTWTNLYRPVCLVVILLVVGTGAGQPTGPPQTMADTMPTVRPVDKPPTVSFSVEPCYPYVARDAGKEGVVVILIPLDVYGRTSLFSRAEKDSLMLLCYSIKRLDSFHVAIIEGYPDDWFFVSNLLKVIPRWRFLPSVIMGKPVRSTITIKYAYVLSGLKQGG